MLSIAFLRVKFLCAYIPVILLFLLQLFIIVSFRIRLSFCNPCTLYPRPSVVGFSHLKSCLFRFGEKLVTPGNVCMYVCLLTGG